MNKIINKTKHETSPKMRKIQDMENLEKSTQVFESRLKISTFKDLSDSPKIVKKYENFLWMSVQKLFTMIK